MYFLRDFLNFHVFHSILNKHGKEEISSSKILSSHSYFSFFLYDFISSLSPRMVFSTLFCPMMPQSLKILHLIKVKSLSRVQLFATPWTVAHQASLSMEFTRQEYRSGLPFPSPEDLPNLGIELWSPALQAYSLPFELQGSPVINLY